ncbi:hypothetical protein FJZ53_01170 [Candidatus Woesearchaeota archaeon]|nr:hypothetical protein [Candidatus Woesearchaeota archaeon]
MTRTAQDTSFLNSLSTATNQGMSYALVPKDFYSIDKSLKQVEGYKSEVETQLSHSKPYLKMRKIFKEKFLGKKVKSISELFDLQLEAMRSINYGLEVINNEARCKLSSLEKYVELINDEYKENFLGIDDKKDSLTPVLKEYVKRTQEFNNLKARDEHYFRLETNLRDMKRRLYEGGTEYAKMLDLVDDLERERKTLNVLEDFFRYSIHLSERMVNKAVRFEHHVTNTKDAYLLAKDINCGFAAVVKAVESSSSMISQLQNVLTEGLAHMGQTMANPDLPPYEEFERNLKPRYDTTRGLVERRDQEKERAIHLQKKGVIR